jgi:hypothetical protein
MPKIPDKETLNERLKRELEIVQQRKGALKPEYVVEYARNPDTELYKHFTWDDTEAAKRYRLEQAAAIIRVCVTVIPYVGGVTTVRAYYSLPEDRKDNPGTYTPLITIMSDETKKLALMQMALDELKAFKKKYDSLRLVAGMEGLFEEIDKVVPPEPVKKGKREKETRA